MISKFENNPRQEMFRSLQDWNTWKEESESDNVHQDLTLKIRKLEFEKRRKTYSNKIMDKSKIMYPVHKRKLIGEGGYGKVFELSKVNKDQSDSN